MPTWPLERQLNLFFMVAGGFIFLPLHISPLIYVFSPARAIPLSAVVQLSHTTTDLSPTHP